jgi:hypothetical protein
VLDEPEHAPTVGGLMTPTAGFTHGVFGDTLSRALPYQAPVDPKK